MRILCAVFGVLRFFFLFFLFSGSAAGSLYSQRVRFPVGFLNSEGRRATFCLLEEEQEAARGGFRPYWT
ncbi:hypothetical protein MASR1M66_11570 [Aminivibrio sp.]